MFAPAGKNLFEAKIKMSLIVFKKGLSHVWPKNH